MEKVHAFFEAYEDRFNRALKSEMDVNEIAGAFADYFVEASPVGIIGSKNDDAFKERIPKGYEFYKSIGTQAMEIRALDVTQLNDMHYMVKACWHSVYEKKDGATEMIDFDVYYFLQEREGRLKIFSYITGDEQAVLKEKGLV